MTERDVVVVGAGILGSASAYHILRNSPGRRVLLLDRLPDAGQGNTGRSNAMFRNTFTSSDNQVLADCAIDFYAHVQHELKVDVGLDPVGYLWLMSERQLRAAEPHLEKMAGNKVSFRRFEEDELDRMLPGFVSGPESEAARLMGLERVHTGIFGPKCGRLAPEKLVGFYRDAFLALGGETIFDAPVKRLLVEAKEKLGVDGEPFAWQDARVGGVELAKGGSIRAGTTVVAAGAWNNELLDPIGIDGHAKAKKRQLFAISTKEDPALDGLLHAKGFNETGTIPFVILPKSSLFVKGVKESGELWVGCEDEINRPFISYPDADLDAYQAEPGYYDQSIHGVLAEYLPQFGSARPRRMWAGLYSYNTLDNMPYVFGNDGLVVVGGDSGSGVMKGDSLGRIADAVFRGEEYAILEGGVHYKASKLSFEARDVEREEWVI